MGQRYSYNFRKLTKMITFALLVLILSGCKTKYVTVEKVSHDTLWHEHMVRDSVYLHDSIFTVQWMMGDTLRIETERWHTKWRERVVHDTTRVVQVDSIPQPYPVEKELSKWEKFCIDYGKVTFGGSIIAVLMGALLVYLKLKK